MYLLAIVVRILAGGTVIFLHVPVENGDSSHKGIDINHEKIVVIRRVGTVLRFANVEKDVGFLRNNLSLRRVFYQGVRKHDLVVVGLCFQSYTLIELDAVSSAELNVLIQMALEFAVHSDSIFHEHTFVQALYRLRSKAHTNQKG